jgi:hypothetical protein
MSNIDRLLEGIAQILLEKNIANTDEIEAFVKECLRHVSTADPETTNRANVEAWIKGNLRNFLVRAGEVDRDGRPLGYTNVERITQPRGDMPSWYYKRLGTGNPIEFLRDNELYWITLTDQFKAEIVEVLDFLLTTQRGRDISAWQVPETIVNAERWSRRRDVDDDELLKAATDDEMDDRNGKGLKPIMKFKNGWFWVEVMHTTDADQPRLAKKVPHGTKSPSGSWSAVSSNPILRRETVMMNHCVGAGTGYGERIRTGECKIYSLRTEKNQPKVTVEVVKPGSGWPKAPGSPGGTVRQAYGYGDRVPTADLWPYLKDLYNKLNLNADSAGGGSAKAIGLIHTQNYGYIDRKDLRMMSTKDIAGLGLSPKQLREMGFIKIGDDLMPFEGILERIKRGELTKDALKDTDLTNEELGRVGLIRDAKTNEVLSWSEMGGRSVGDMKFETTLTPIDFAEDITFKNLSFSGYPGTSLPRMKVTGSLTIQGGALCKIAPGTTIAGNLKILNTQPFDHMDGIEIGGNLEIEGTRIVLMTNVQVGRNAEFKGEGVWEIGDGCLFKGNIQAAKTAFRKISANTDLTQADIRREITFEGTPLEVWPIEKVTGSLDLSESKIREFAVPSFEIDGPTTRHTICLNLSNTSITHLPDDVTVNGWIIALNEVIEQIPARLKARSVWIPKGAKANVYPATASIMTFLIANENKEYKWVHDEKLYKASKQSSEVKGRNFNPVTKNRLINPGDIIDDDRPDAKNEAPKKPRAKRKTT